MGKNGGSLKDGAKAFVLFLRGAQLVLRFNVLTLLGLEVDVALKYVEITSHDNDHHSGRIMRTYHTHFGAPVGLHLPAGMTEKEIISLYRLSTFTWVFQQSQPCTFLPSPFWP